MGSPRFRLLGPVEVDGAGALGGPKQRALLARLLLHANELVHRERLIDVLWPDDPPETAAHAVQVYVSQLRKALPPGARLVTQGTAYRLEVDEDDVDVLRFERLVERGRRLLRDGDPHGAAEVLRDAERLWRGPLDAMEAAEAARLEELRLAAVEERVEAELAAGGHAELVPELGALVHEHPLRERIRRQLMTALYRSGRQADALDAYHDARRAFVDELGIEPGHELRELEQAILRQDAALAAAPARLRRLPAPHTPLVGRRRELDELTALLRGEARLVTLTGPGGAGKTRLALELGHLLEDAFADGVVFVELATLRDPGLVAGEIARAVGADDGASLPRRLRDAELLLVLDNFEQVDEEAATLADLLDTRAVRLLVTSRRPLRLYGEYEHRLRPLPTEEAVELFVARARAVRRDFRESPEVTRLCARLDGLPLAIELVAARVRDLSLAELVEAIPSRLDAAVAGPRDVPPRHRTLRATIEWSETLLDERERLAFAHLAVFAGSFSAASAAAVWGIGRDVLASLAEQSLLVRRDERYAYLETIREYALERLRVGGDADELRRRHAEHFASLAAEGAALRMTDAEVQWMDRLELDRENLREAITWLHDHDVAAAAELVVDLFRFWYTRLHFEEAGRAYGDVRERAHDLPAATRAQLLRYSAAFAFARRDLAETAALAEGALELDRERGDDVAAARDLVMLGTAYGEEGDARKAVPLLEESVSIARGTADRRLLSFTTMHLALAALSAHEYARAADISTEAIALLREVGDGFGEANARSNLGVALLSLGHVSDAAEEFAASLDLSRQFRDTPAVLSAIEGIAAAATRQGRWEAAARLLGASAAAAESHELTLELLSRSLREDTLALLRASAGEEAVDSALAAGRSLSFDDAAGTASAIAKTLRAEGGITAAPEDGANAPPTGR